MGYEEVCCVLGCLVLIESLPLLYLINCLDRAIATGTVVSLYLARPRIIDPNCESSYLPHLMY